MRGVEGWKVDGCRLKFEDMKLDPQKHHRRSIRLKDYDYSQAGAYYVTINVQNRECLFGEIVDYEMILNEAGKTIEEQWLTLLERFPNIELDFYQIMPNHSHGIIVIVESELGVKPRAGKSPASTLGDIVGAFKSITTHEYIQGVGNKNWRQFYKRL
jgi:REP element-mobilizing transposase RayT